jgi:hypothetical protein
MRRLVRGKTYFEELFALSENNEKPMSLSIELYHNRKKRPVDKNPPHDPAAENTE